MTRSRHTTVDMVHNSTGYCALSLNKLVMVLVCQHRRRECPPLQFSLSPAHPVFASAMPSVLLCDPALRDVSHFVVLSCRGNQRLARPYSRWKNRGHVCSQGCLRVVPNSLRHHSPTPLSKGHIWCRSSNSGITGSTARQILGPQPSSANVHSLDAISSPDSISL